MKKHLAIFKGEAGEKILLGKKTIESRFSRVKNPPFGLISQGDLVYIKPSGKEIIGQFRVKKVIFFDGLDAFDVRQIREQFNKELAEDQDYWDKVKASRYGSLIFIGDSSRFITSPIRIKKSDLRGWVVIS
jgi:predicted transcriptional regulator